MRFSYLRPDEQGCRILLTLMGEPVRKISICWLCCQWHEVAFHTELCKSWLEKVLGVGLDLLLGSTGAIVGVWASLRGV